MVTAADAANASLAREYDADEDFDDTAGHTKPMGMRTVSMMWTHQLLKEGDNLERSMYCTC